MKSGQVHSGRFFVTFCGQNSVRQKPYQLVLFIFLFCYIHVSQFHTITFTRGIGFLQISSKTKLLNLTYILSNLTIDIFHIYLTRRFHMVLAEDNKLLSLPTSYLRVSSIWFFYCWSESNSSSEYVSHFTWQWARSLTATNLSRYLG